MTVTFPGLKPTEAALLLPALTAINVGQLATLAASGAPVPSLIEDLRAGHIRYIRKDEGEEWRSLREIYRRGGGDCEDLAAGVAAELQFWGFEAEAFPYQTSIPGLAHVVVWAAFSPTILDPSRLGGMGSNAV